VKIVDQQVYVNGRPMPEPYVIHDPTAPYDPFGDTFPPTNRRFLERNVRPEWADEILKYVRDGELVVPPDRYFVMGDNRERSWDGRYWGFVDREAVMGRPILIYWSLDATSAVSSPRSFGGGLLGRADTVAPLPMKTRWGRMFRGVH